MSNLEVLLAVIPAASPRPFVLYRYAAGIAILIVIATGDL